MPSRTATVTGAPVLTGPHREPGPHSALGSHFQWPCHHTLGRGPHHRASWGRGAGKVPVARSAASAVHGPLGPEGPQGRNPTHCGPLSSVPPGPCASTPCPQILYPTRGRGAGLLLWKAHPSLEATVHTRVPGRPLLCRDTKHLRKPGASLTPPSARDTHSTLQDYALHPHEGSPVPTAPGSTTGIPPSPHLRVRAPHSAWQRSSGRGRCILKDTPGRGESSTKVNLRDLKQPAGGKEPWGASKPLACGKASFFKPGSAEAEGSHPAPPGLPAAQARERYGPRGAVTHACRRRLPVHKTPPSVERGHPPSLPGWPPSLRGWL